uniref:DNA ligase IV n=1 Tax=Strongyloides stercoralis TaxID=6248 RepID=A0A0K0DUN6_STRER
MKTSIADCLSFYDFCVFLEDISSKSDNQTKEKLFQEFLKWWFDHKEEVFTIYPILRLMSQESDDENFFTFEYSHLSNMINNDLKFKKTDCTQIIELPILIKIDLLVNKYIMKNIPSNLSVRSINEYLDKILQGNNTEKHITTLLRDMNNLERKWFLLILLSEVENITNMSFALLLYLINPSLEQLLNNGYHLQNLLSQYNPKTFSEETFKKNLNCIQIGKALFPMKLNEFGVKKNHFLALKNFCKGKLLAENYYQGDHIMIHRYNSGKCYKYFSDTLDDYTKFYQSSNYNFSQEIEQFFKEDVKNVILEGQMLVLCKNSKEVIEKFDTLLNGTLYDTRFIHSNDSQVKLCFNILDILYFNNMELSNSPLEERLKILNENVFHNINNESIIISKKIEVEDYDDFFKCLYDSNACMRKGFILRDSASLYTSGTIPIHHCCFKIKPDYNKFITLTMAIVGAEYHTDNTNHIKYFLLAAKDSKNNKPTICLKINPTSKSTIYQFLIDLLNINNSYFVKLPNWLQSKLPLIPNSRFILQNHIVIVEVKWTKINQENNELMYISKIKREKKINNISLVSDVEYFDKRLNEKLNNIEVMPRTLKSLYFDDFNYRRIFYKNKHLDDWKYFKEITICVLNSSQQCSKTTAQKFLTFLGASIVAHPTKDTNFVIATDPLNIRTAAVLKEKYSPILDISWVVKCMNDKRLKKIDIQNDIILAIGKNKFSLESINLLFEEKNIPEDIFNYIFM